MARLCEYDIEVCKKICEEVANGKNVIDVLNSNERFPSWSTFRNWKRDNEELQTLYTSSIQDKAEAVDFEIDNIMRDCKAGEIDPPTARVLIDTLKWKAAKYYPKMFGDKNTVDMNLNVANAKRAADLLSEFEKQINGEGTE